MVDKLSVPIRDSFFSAERVPGQPPLSLGLTSQPVTRGFFFPAFSPVTAYRMTFRLDGNLSRRNQRERVFMVSFVRFWKSRDELQLTTNTCADVQLI